MTNIHGSMLSCEIEYLLKILVFIAIINAEKKIFVYFRSGREAKRNGETED